ncbi:hypothetical protein BU23DRAFT_195999 [Bimuria novae-zelandiae CBS 107.79]|uniref:Uncharacterized protein n=1 Tax=Bimuria novae-zelandiae CBS 107.79 TaxID=1447943 RepID=A0A6A5V855_9PLEO|nr:hypothetical protein BU23DRAFT_195999 [Bimuria novae-zelandiae CBS 107.79]
MPLNHSPISNQPYAPAYKKRKHAFDTLMRERSLSKRIAPSSAFHITHASTLQEKVRSKRTCYALMLTVAMFGLQTSRRDRTTGESTHTIRLPLAVTKLS